jgi:predicted nucleotidyltransferase
VTDIHPVIVGEVGSVAHGLGVAESDHDYHGVFIDPPDSVIGLRAPRGAHRDRDQPEGVRSEPGDEETTYYGLRHYASQCAKGNPTYLTLLYTPVLTVPDMIGLQAVRDMFLSKRLAARHIGYAESMYRRLTGDLAPRTNRPWLIEEHGYDTKAAFHAIRLLMQGWELLMRGTMTMPMVSVEQRFLLAVRHGEVDHERAVRTILNWRGMIEHAETVSKLPDHPDMDRINRWLIDTHQDYWRYPWEAAA